MSKAKRDYHLVYRPQDEVWALQREGGKRATELFDTKAQGLKESREHAKNQQVELVIHGKDNRIQDSDSYGGDPKRSKDTKH